MEGDRKVSKEDKQLLTAYFEAYTAWLKLNDIEKQLYPMPKLKQEVEEEEEEIQYIKHCRTCTCI